MASVYTMASVYGGENTTGSVYSAQDTMGSVYTRASVYAPTSVYGHNTATDSDEASARALKAKLRQACDNLSKIVWVEDCDTAWPWEPVQF